MADQLNQYTNAFETSLTALMDATQMTATVASVSSLQFPTYLVIEPDEPTQREYVRVDGTVGLTLQLSERYSEGSAAPSGLTHGSGATVRSASVAQFFRDLSDRIDADAADFDLHDGGTATTNHPEATVSTRGFMSAADKTKMDALDTADQVTGGDTHDHAGGDGAQVDHGGLGGLADDDHTQYLKEKASGGLAAETPTHTHASAAEAGTVAHSVLTGLSNDEHTGYLNVTRHDNEHSALEARRATTDQSIPDAVETQLVFNSVVNESDADGDFTLDTGTGALTINNAGWYEISAGVIWAVVGDSTRRGISIMLNATVIVLDVEPSPTGITIGQTVTRLKKLAATDIITVSLFQVRSPAAALNARNDAGTFLTIHRVRSV